MYSGLVSNNLLMHVQNKKRTFFSKSVTRFSMKRGQKHKGYQQTDRQTETEIGFVLAFLVYEHDGSKKYKILSDAQKDLLIMITFV